MIRKRLSFPSKKGNTILDTLTVSITIVAFIIISIIGYVFLQEFQPSADTEFNTSDNTSQVIFYRTYNNYPALMDGIIGFVFFGLWIAAIVASLFIDSHPAFFFIALFLVSALLFVSFAMSNSYIDIFGSGDLYTAASQFPIGNFIMDKLPYLTIAMFITIGGALYLKIR